MPAYLKIGDIKGESTEQDHKEWVIIESMSASINRTIPQGAKDQQRTKGETSLSDVVVTRQMDKSSTKLQQACAAGKFFPEVEVHFCSTVKNKQEPYLKYKLGNVIVSSYSMGAQADGGSLPQETVTLGFTKAEWTYVILDPETGDVKGNVPAAYEPGTSKAS